MYLCYLELSWAFCNKAYNQTSNTRCDKTLMKHIMAHLPDVKNKWKTHIIKFHPAPPQRKEKTHTHIQTPHNFKFKRIWFVNSLEFATHI